MLEWVRGPNWPLQLIYLAPISYGEPPDYETNKTSGTVGLTIVFKQLINEWFGS